MITLVPPYRNRRTSETAERFHHTVETVDSTERGKPVKPPPAWREGRLRMGSNRLRAGEKPGGNRSMGVSFGVVSGVGRGVEGNRPGMEPKVTDTVSVRPAVASGSSVRVQDAHVGAEATCNVPEHVARSLEHSDCKTKAPVMRREEQRDERLNL